MSAKVILMAWLLVPGGEVHLNRVPFQNESECLLNGTTMAAMIEQRSVYKVRFECTAENAPPKTPESKSQALMNELNNLHVQIRDYKDRYAADSRELRKAEAVKNKEKITQLRHKLASWVKLIKKLEDSADLLERQILSLSEEQ